jgi:hypothetical protein
MYLYFVLVFIVCGLKVDDLKHCLLCARGSSSSSSIYCFNLPEVLVSKLFISQLTQTSSLLLFLFKLLLSLLSLLIFLTPR